MEYWIITCQRLFDQVSKTASGSSKKVEALLKRSSASARFQDIWYVYMTKSQAATW